MALADVTRAGLANIRARVPWYAFVIFAVIALAIGFSLVGDAELSTIAATVGIFAGHATAGFMFIRKARQVDPSERRAWTMVGVGFTIAAMGIVIVTIQFVVTGDAPTIGPVDLFFLAGYLLTITGFALLPHTAGTVLQRSRTGLDGLIGAISITALAWVLFLSRIVEGVAESPIWERTIGSAYPMADVAVVVIIMIVILRRSSFRFDPRLVLFAIAVAIQTLGDVSFIVSGVGTSFAEAQPLYPAFLLAAGAFLATALIVDIQPEPREYADRNTPLWSVLAPYGAAIAMLFVLISRLGDAELDTGDRILFFATLLVAVLVIVRQAVSIRENRILIEQQRTDLVSSISHELRTPLTAMLGWLSVLHYNEVDGPRERAEAIEIVHHQANYLSRIVEDLLLLVDDRDPTQMRLTLGPVDVRTTIQNAINATSINRERIDVEADRGLIAHVDAERLEQILVNLITNADRYGAGRCLVAAFPRGGTLVLEVHDAGPGVPTKYELMVWERFERGQFKYIAGERGREVEGTGIGLAVVETIAKAHGGRVGYRPSERLGGACFFVELPGRVDTQKGPSPVELPGVVTELRATS